MKKFLASILAVMMLASMATGCTPETEAGGEGGDVAAADVTVGVAIYKFDDTFMTGVRNTISEQAKTLGIAEPVSYTHLRKNLLAAAFLSSVIFAEVPAGFPVA